MKAGERLWRTGDGGLVRDGDPAGATLAYAAGDDIAAADQAKVPGAQAKASAPAANKSRRPQGNKGG